MKLNTLERLVLLSILPEKGDLTTLRIVRQLREALSFTETEHAILQFKTDDGRARWLQRYGEEIAPPEGVTREKADAALAELNEGVEIDIGLKAAHIIQERLAEMNTDENLEYQHLSLCEKFEIEQE